MKRMLTASFTLLALVAFCLCDKPMQSIAKAENADDPKEVQVYTKKEVDDLLSKQKKELTDSFIKMIADGQFAKKGDIDTITDKLKAIKEGEWRLKRIELGRTGSSIAVSDPKWDISRPPNYTYQLEDGERIQAVWFSVQKPAHAGLRCAANNASIGTNKVQIEVDIAQPNGAPPVRPFMMLPDDPINVYVLYRK